MIKRTRDFVRYETTRDGEQMVNIDGVLKVNGVPMAETLSELDTKLDEAKEELSEDIATSEARVTSVMNNGYTIEPNYQDNKSVYTRWYPPQYILKDDDQSILSFEVPVTSGITIKHMTGYRYWGDSATIIELDENHNIIDPRSRSANTTDDTEKTVTLRDNTKYLLIPCLKSKRATAYVKDSNGNLIWKPLGGEFIKGLIALNETPTFKLYTQEEKNVSVTTFNDYEMSINIDFPVSKIVSISVVLSQSIDDYLTLGYPYDYKIINTIDSGYDDLKVIVKNSGNGDNPIDIKVTILYID